jgi:hypothetical protein
MRPGCNKNTKQFLIFGQQSSERGKGHGKSYGLALNIAREVEIAGGASLFT